MHPSSIVTTQRLANRIRTAYLRHRTWWDTAASDAEVWMAAATVLHEAHRDDPRLPLDPELFVAAQPGCRAIADPWDEIAGPRSAARYRRRVGRMIRRLRRELRRELRRVRRDLPLDRQLTEPRLRLSPMARYVAAVQSGRPDLAARLRDEALRHHESCPLYRLACVGLLPDGTYPSSVPLPALPLGVDVGKN